jgi:hypothetical protein
MSCTHILEVDAEVRKDRAIQEIGEITGADFLDPRSTKDESGGPTRPLRLQDGIFLPAR